MKKIINKLKAKLNNQGSSLILVIVALAFIGILVGSLLTAVGYTYKLKLYDYNARDNFYYVEQAMDEIYAGVGSKTVEFMQEAYQDTVENMVYYSIENQAYVNIGDEAANKMFKNTFMDKIKANETMFSSGLGVYVSNPSVVFDASRVRVEKVWDPADNTKLLALNIKNITVSRTAEYARSQANGTFTQTISADIVISRPDFNVNFNTINADYTQIFNFAVVSDSGVEVNLPTATPLTINGSIYAAADFYNKTYNNYGNKTYQNEDQQNKYVGNYYSISTDGTTSVVTDRIYAAESHKIDKATGTEYYTYKLNPVSNYVEGTLKNNNHGNGSISYLYDGQNEYSMYSGFYINGSDVSILAEDVIVPGTIAVMNAGSLSVYGKNGRQLSTADIWTDNVVLGGTSALTSSGDPKGAEANIRANMYVKDDLELNATASSFSLFGTYYGYSDSTSSDDRAFVPTVNTDNYRVEETKNNTVNRTHYNSSAIVINGENSTLNLSNLTTLFLAGRAYIEMSEAYSTSDFNTSKTTYVYDSKINDYQTGESISVRPNQLAYIPVVSGTFTEVPNSPVDANGKPIKYVGTLPQVLAESALFRSYFGSDGKVPCLCIRTSGKDYFYYDFETAMDELKVTNVAFAAFFDNDATKMAAGFIDDYYAEFEDEKSAIKDYLVDIGQYKNFDVGEIKLPSVSKLSAGSNVYSSGAITAKSDTVFSIVSADATNGDTLAGLRGTAVSNKLLESDIDVATVSSAGAIQLSDNIEKHYNYVKWALKDLRESDAEAKFVDSIVAAKGVGSITPINRYLNMDLIGATTNYDEVLPSGYHLWISGSNPVYVTDDDSDGIVKGIIITKNDVYFNSDVTKFEGLIIAGGKVYINTGLTTLSSNIEVCKAILSECQMSTESYATLLVSLFKNYEGSSLDPTLNDDSTKTINTIDYSDVVRYDNWMKNVD